MSPATNEQLQALLVDRALGMPLSAEEEASVERALAPGSAVPTAAAREYDALEQAAAALHLALIADHIEPMPPASREGVRLQAERFFEAKRPRGRLLRPGLAGWFLAAAVVVVMTARQPDPAALPPIDAITARADSIVRDWTTTEDALSAGVTGRVVWNAELQQGYMEFDGLPANDPSRGQYQLWIFDAGRPEAYPIDGGVFDSDGATQTVPITAKLDVESPTLFAVTYEQPGGVVVSARERVVVVASVD